VGRHDTGTEPVRVEELVLSGTAEAPKAEHIAAIESFMPNALETIGRLRDRLSFSFLWDPMRIAVNNQNRSVVRPPTFSAQARGPSVPCTNEGISQVRRSQRAFEPTHT